MDPVSGVNSVSGSNPGISTNNVVLASFAAKITAGGDLASECMALMAEDNACQVRANLQGIRVQQRVVRQARQRRMELLKKQWAAKKKSGFWAKLGKIFSGVFSVLAGALSFFACPMFGVGLAGAAVSAGCEIASGAHARKAGRAAADALQAEQYQQIAKEASEYMLQSLNSAAELEKRMAAKITALVESESQSKVLK